MEADKQLLDRAQWLATQPALDIKVFHSRVTLDRWQPFCDACTNGSLQSDADHADLAQLYGRRGGHVLNPNYDTDTPPAYEDTDGPPADVPQPSRKRQRASPVLTSQVMGKEFELFIRTICTKIVAQQRDAMIAPLLARMKEMEDLITDNVMANIEGVLQKRLVEMREELQDGLDESLDRRVDALKEEIGDHVKEEVKEQVGEEIGRVEEDLVETVMDRMA